VSCTSKGCATFFQLLDASDLSAGWVRQLENTVGFEDWYSAARYTKQGMVGSGTLNWAKDRTERLGQTLALFRHFSRTKGAYADFSIDFLYVGSRYDDMVAGINDQLFRPFARDLLKDLRRFNDQGVSVVPASDRIVRLDHNAASYKELSAGLEVIENAVRTSNELGANAPEERDRVVAELSAGRRLLRAVQVRVEAAWRLLVPALEWAGAKLTDKAWDIAITAAIMTLAQLLGVSIPGL
jgi:hypothetical protein